MSFKRNGKTLILKIKKNWGKIIILLLIIYFISPIQIAIDGSKIDKNRNYLIVEMTAVTDCDFHILYDSQGRNINYVSDSNRVLHFFTKFTGFYGDIMGNLNKYVIYTDDNDIERNVLIVKDYDINILYPIKRDHDLFYPNNMIFRFETILPFA